MREIGARTSAISGTQTSVNHRIVQMLHTMDFLSFALIAMAAGSVYYYFKRKLSYFKDRGVPYEPGLPVFGNVAPVLFKIQHLSEMIGKIYNAHPDAKYVGAFSFGQPVIILRDPALIKTITISHFERFRNRRIAVEEKVDPFLGVNLFNLKGDRWREIRNILSPAFTASKLKCMLGQMVECCENFNGHLSGLSEEDRKEVPTKDLFSKYTANVIAACIFGVAIDSLENPNNDIYVLGKEHAVFEGWMMFKFYMAIAFPRLMKLLNVKVINDQVVSVFKSIVRHVIETRDREGFARTDVVQLMMDARGVNDKTVKLDVDTITSQAFILLIGGFDTTSTQMCIIAQELALNPNIQKKVQDEIDRIVQETNGEASYEAMQKMQYFDAVFSESLRRHTDVVIQDRVCEKPLELPPALPGGKPFVIQPGTIIWIPGKSIHMDSKYYENPSAFEPERYYQKMSKNNELNLGFGIGPRACIGHRFARLQTKVLFFYLLSKFSLVPNEKTKSPIKYCKDSSNVKPDGGFCLSIKRRNK